MAQNPQPPQKQQPPAPAPDPNSAPVAGDCAGVTPALRKAVTDLYGPVRIVVIGKTQLIVDDGNPKVASRKVAKPNA